MVSIKRLVLLNVLVWIFPQKSLWNDLVYLKFWEPQNMKIKEILKVSIKRPDLSQISNPESQNDLVLL